MVSEPERYVPGLNATSLATGSVALMNGRAQAVFQESVRDISLPRIVPGFSISGVNSNVFAVLKLPLSAEVWPSLAAVLLTDCSNISYQDARIEQIRLAVGLMDGKTATTSAKMTSGQSRAEMFSEPPVTATRRIARSETDRRSPHFQPGGHFGFHHPKPDRGRPERRRRSPIGSSAGRRNHPIQRQPVEISRDDPAVAWIGRGF